LLEFTEAANIRVGMAAPGKVQALDALADLAVSMGLVADRDRLLQALWLREGIVTTGIGHGIAIPHADLPEIEQPRLVLGIFPGGVDFDSLDEEPVHLIFMLLGTPRTPGLHMKILARIARLSKDPDLVEGLCSCASPEEALVLLRRIDERH
jgi:PTS system fructose-specific IIC component